MSPLPSSANAAEIRVAPRNVVLHGDCVQVMRTLPAASVDFVFTDPPYLVRYRSRSGQTIQNDDNDAWLKPAFKEISRLMKPDTFCVSFYGWNVADRFFEAWHTAGLRVVGHIVFRKQYASSQRFLMHQHECAYLLAKGRPMLPPFPLPDTFGWDYTGNRLHPTQKPLTILEPLVKSFCRPSGLVLDPFCGSGSSLVAAVNVGADALGIEIDSTHSQTAARRLARTAGWRLAA